MNGEIDRIIGEATAYKELFEIVSEKGDDITSGLLLQVINRKLRRLDERLDKVEERGIYVCLN